MLALVDGDPLLYTAAWGKATPGDAKAHLRWLVNDIVESTIPDDYLIAMGSRDSSQNFRVGFFPFYKKSPSRMASKSKLQPWFDELKDELVSLPNVFECNGFEADDQLRIWASEAALAEDPFVVCSIDKDLDAIPGLHLNTKKKEFYKVTKAYSDWFFWKQVLMGDSVDNIPGIFKLGPKTADKILAAGSNWEEYEALTVAVYKEKHGDEWWDYLMANARLLHIWRHYDDHFELNKSKYI